MKVLVIHVQICAVRLSRRCMWALLAMGIQKTGRLTCFPYESSRDLTVTQICEIWGPCNSHMTHLIGHILWINNNFLNYKSCKLILIATSNFSQSMQEKSMKAATIQCKNLHIYVCSYCSRFKMHFLIASAAVIVLVCFTVDVFQLPCDNPLRYFRVYLSRNYI